MNVLGGNIPAGKDDGHEGVIPPGRTVRSGHRQAIKVVDEPVRLENHIYIPRTVRVEIVQDRLVERCVWQACLAQVAAGNRLGNTLELQQLFGYRVFDVARIEIMLQDRFVIDVITSYSIHYTKLYDGIDKELISGYNHPYVYLNHEAILQHHLDPRDVEHAVAEQP